MNTRDNRPDGAILTVPGLLNIFYREWKLVVVLTALGLVAGIAYGIVVKPLYRATAQVRPGVVSYNPDGFPNREWALEDIVNWFASFLYWEDFKQVPAFAAMKSAPVIDASFIPSLNFVVGGNVITLTNLALSPDLASATLDEAIQAFNRQAMADSMGSSLHLTLRQGRSAMRKLTGDIEQVDAQADRVRLDIDLQQRELSIIELQSQELEIGLKTREADNVWIKEAIINSRADVETARGRLAEAEKVLTIAMGQEQQAEGKPAVSAVDPVGGILRQAATREQAGRVGDLLMTVNSLSAFINLQSVRADSLEARVRANELEMDRIRLLQDIQIGKQKADVAQKITDLNITLDKDLPHARGVLKSVLETERVKVDLISPLERVGTVSVTDKPVRPRKARAAAILAILGFFGALFLVLVREYFHNNREAITAPRHPNV
jgi:hypothetical protein